MFLHGGLLHLGGNMLFLWIFGNNVEDRLGTVGYAALLPGGRRRGDAGPRGRQPRLDRALVGASGAIAAVMGAYLSGSPGARIRTLVIYLSCVERARQASCSGFWFVLQFFTDPNEGVAWVAHVGGFVFGVLVGSLLRGSVTAPAAHGPPPALERRLRRSGAAAERPSGRPASGHRQSRLAA